MSPKKSLGQHFLTSPSYAERIAEAITAQPDERILEIGPGKGALSIYIKDKFRDYHLVEVDTSVISSLKEKLGEGPWVVHNRNIMDFDYAEAGFPLHVAGNLPYNIAAHIIHKTLLYGNDILSCTFMVQREVAQRIAASPGTKKNGYLTIFCRFFGSPRILFTVPPGAFFPRPGVDSAVFQLIPDKNLESKLPRDRWKAFFGFIDKGFRYRRKKLLNVLAKIDNTISWTEIFEMLNIDQNVRAENLGIELWILLYRESQKAGHEK
ncbi:MAG: ribosomal RNA small subunit methyltransferase A [Chitinivibrionales bacterium]|nr:ribosomal RNA small subunit methyltransferase A [Chitinivibrionales bacterium]